MLPSVKAKPCWLSQLVGHCRQSLCNGISFDGQSLYAGRRQRVAQLVDLIGPRGDPYPSCSQALLWRLAWRRLGQHGLCVGLQHDRSVSEPVRVGVVSLDQGRHQAAHTTRSARMAVAPLHNFTDTPGSTKLTPVVERAKNEKPLAARQIRLLDSSNLRFSNVIRRTRQTAPVFFQFNQRWMACRTRVHR